MADRSTFTPNDTITHIWNTLGLPTNDLPALHLTGAGPGLPSSFKVVHLAQSSIALSALTAALIHATRNGRPLSDYRVTVPLDHACVEFRSERFYTLDGKSPEVERSVIGGLHATTDGYVRVHDAFAHHRDAALRILGVDGGATKEEINAKIKLWRAVDLETTALDQGAVIVALRSFERWDATPQGTAVADFPIQITKIGDAPPKGWEARLVGQGADKCLRGVRVLEITRVIAAPVAGRTLAAHGADVLWVTSAKLPSLPALDVDTGRGKRSCHLDLDDDNDRRRFEGLLSEADVFVQSYRGGSLEGRGFGALDVAKRSKDGIVVGTLSAYGSDGPWRAKRGFDSMVQTCSGLNIVEAERYGEGEVATVLPCQALDHASGYFLATGIMAALYRQTMEGGSYQVEVSLAATMKYLRSLGQLEGKSGFECRDYETQKDVPDEFFETRASDFGSLRAVKHTASIDGVDVGWEKMPKPLGSDDAAWL